MERDSLNKEVILEALMQALPYVGGSLATLYFGHKQEKRFKRLEKFYEELKEEDEIDFLLVEGVCINYCYFQNCNIKNIIFRRCNFLGSFFINVRFDQVIFDSCIFSVPVIEDGKSAIDDIYYASPIFKTCTFAGRFSDCDIEHVLFEKICFISTSFERSSLQESVFNMCALSSVDIKDCNLCNFGICNTDILELSFSDEHRSIVDENTFIDYRVNMKKEKNEAEITTASGWGVKQDNIEFTNDTGNRLICVMDWLYF